MEIKTDIDEENEFQSINIQESNKEYEGYGSTSQLDSSPLPQLAVGKSCVKKLTEYEFNTEKLEPGIVGVYIWNSGFQGGEGVGHISVGFGQQYVSFWPNSGYKRLLMCSGQLPEVREADVFYLLKTNENDFQIYPSKMGKLETEILSQEQCHALRCMQKLPQFPTSGNEPIEITGIDNHNLINDITEICGCIHWLGGKKTKFGEFEGYWLKERRQDMDKEERPPDSVFHIRGLDIERMQKKFKEIKSTIPQWRLLASTPFKKNKFVYAFKKKDSSLNCVAVAIEILRAGGIEELAGEKITKKTFNPSLSCKALILVSLFVAFTFSWGYLAIIAILKIAFPHYSANLFQKYHPVLLTMVYVALPVFLVTGILGFIDLCFYRCSNATGLYSEIRHLYKHSLIPSGRIIEILNKAVINTSNNSMNSKYTGVSEKFDEIDLANDTNTQIIVDLEEELQSEGIDNYRSVFAKPPHTEGTLNIQNVFSQNKMS